jgi:hypothetical protein
MFAVANLIKAPSLATSPTYPHPHFKAPDPLVFLSESLAF